jgi:hypothetical protein
MQELKPEFLTYLKRMWNQHAIVVVTHDIDDFGNRRNNENIISRQRAEEILNTLKNTIEEYDRTTI